MLVVDQLSKRYGETTVVNRVSFSVVAGECFALLGPNGAGKTTTLRCCLGLTNLDSGTITMVGHNIPAEAKAARAKVGIVPQADNLDPDFTTEENLLVYGRYFGLADAHIKKRIPDLLDFAGLSTKANVPIQALSGGMKRRLTIARALINDPELLILDEPTTGLDPQARRLIWERLRSLVSAGKSILLTTHFMEEAERLADRLAVMDGGKIVAMGAVEALMQEHFPVSPDPHHPANLEDLFIKLTGHELRD